MAEGAAVLKTKQMEAWAKPIDHRPTRAPVSRRSGADRTATWPARLQAGPQATQTRAAGVQVLMTPKLEPL